MTCNELLLLLRRLAANLHGLRCLMIETVAVLYCCAAGPSGSAVSQGLEPATCDDNCATRQWQFEEGLCMAG